MVSAVSAPVCAPVSVVVVNWNGERYLPECLDAIFLQTPPPGEVIVADNHSDDGSRALLAARYPQVKVIDLGSNLGPAAARNRGVEAATGERVLCVDNDVVLQPGVLARLNAALDADPRAALVQARSVLAAAPDTVHYDAADVHYLGMLVLHNWYRPLRDATAFDRPLSGAVALCFLARRAAYLAVGGFYAPMFILYEDNDLALRLRLRGFTVRHEASAIVLHKGGTEGLSMRGEGARYPPRRTFLHSRNRWLLLLTCLHWRTLLLTLPAQLAYDGVHLLFAIKQGHFGAWLSGKWAVVRMLGATWRRRREVQRTRVVADRDLLVGLPFSFNPQIGKRGLGAIVRRGLDVAFVGYWRLVRWACG